MTDPVRTNDLSTSGDTWGKALVNYSKSVLKESAYGSIWGGMSAYYSTDFGTNYNRETVIDSVIKGFTCSTVFSAIIPFANAAADKLQRKANAYCAKHYGIKQDGAWFAAGVVTCIAGTGYLTDIVCKKIGVDAGFAGTILHGFIGPLIVATIKQRTIVPMESKTTESLAEGQKKSPTHQAPSQQKPVNPQTGAISDVSKKPLRPVDQISATTIVAIPTQLTPQPTVSSKQSTAHPQTPTLKTSTFHPSAKSQMPAQPQSLRLPATSPDHAKTQDASKPVQKPDQTAWSLRQYSNNIALGAIAGFALACFYNLPSLGNLVKGDRSIASQEALRQMHLFSSTAAIFSAVSPLTYRLLNPLIDKVNKACMVFAKAHKYQNTVSLSATGINTAMVLPVATHFAKRVVLGQ